MAVNFVPSSSTALDLGDDINVLRNVPAATMTAWVRPETNPSGAGFTIVGVAVGPPPGASTNIRMSIAISFSGGLRIQTSVRALDGDVTAVFSSNVLSSSLGQWVHVGAAMDYVNRVLNVYENGSLINTTSPGTTAGNTSDTNSKNGAIGSAVNTVGKIFDGDIEDVRVYERLLGDAEIATIYAARGMDGILSGCRLRYTLTELAPGQPVLLAPSIGTLNRGASPVNSPLYSAGVTNTRSRPISPT